LQRLTKKLQLGRNRGIRGEQHETPILDIGRAYLAGQFGREEIIAKP